MCLDHRVKTVLNPRKHLGIALENINYFRIRLLEEADRSSYNFSPPSKASSMVRGPKKYNTAGEMEDIVEMSLRPLPRLEQGLPRESASSFT